MKRIALLSVCFVLNVSFAQIALDKTRVIIDRDKVNTEVVVLTNRSETTPYLAQSWIDNEQGQKITSGVMALPILQRLDPKNSSQVKLDVVGDVTFLPKDREGLLFLNVLGVPPQNTSGKNKLDIVIQSKIKVFYRPVGLKKYSIRNGWINQMIVTKSGSSATFENPSPYHIVIFAYKGQSGKAQEKEILLKPFSTEKVNIALGNRPEFHIVNDFGAAKVIKYSCSNSGTSVCSLVEGVK